LAIIDTGKLSTLGPVRSVRTLAITGKQGEVRMGVIEDIKEVVKLVQSIDNIDLYRKILDLQAEVTGLVQDKLQLAQQVQDLTDKLAIKGSLEFRDEGYWRKCDDGKEDGPFCTACWDSDKKLVRSLLVRGVYGCPVCGSIRAKPGVPLPTRTLAEVKMALSRTKK